MIWPLLAFASLAVNIAAMVRVGSREPKRFLTFGVGLGADVDSTRAETNNYIDTGNLYPPGTNEAASHFFDDGMWVDKSVVDDDDSEALDDAIVETNGVFGTTEQDLWNRPDLVGGWR